MVRHQAIHSRRRTAAVCWLLGMLLLRAYVPVGFMPATGAPFLLEFCPAAGLFPANARLASSTPGVADTASMNIGAAAHRDHVAHIHTASSPASHHHLTFDQCPFGSAPAAGPLAHYVVFVPAEPAFERTPASSIGVAPSLRLQRAHPPRGPPALT